MAIFNWRARKKIVFFLIPTLLIGGVIFLVIYFVWPESTCFDGKQNQDEEKIDCGGQCSPCVADAKDIMVLWTRVLKINEGVYEVASLIENPNVFYGLSVFKYTFKIYDSNNVLVAIKDGQTFSSPGDRFVIFVTDINTGERDATHAFVEIEELTSWQYIDKEKYSVIISSKNFLKYPLPTLRATLQNESVSTLRDIEASAVLYDEEGNAIAVSSTKVGLVGPESAKEIFFTWPISFTQEPFSTEIFTRVNIMMP